MRNMIFPFFLLLLSLQGFAQDQAYNIKVNIDGYQEKELYLGHFYGDKQLIKDTARVQGDGSFVFMGEEALDPGMYLIVLAPDNDFLQILVGEKEQEFSLSTSRGGLMDELEVKGSPDNQLFLSYLSFLKEARTKAEGLSAKLQATASETEQASIKSALEQLNQGVQQKQKEILEQAPESLSALIIKANLPISTPEFEGTPAEIQQKKLYYYRKHYFDHIDLKDPRMIRTQFFFNKVTEYVERLHYQIPDSLIVAMDDILGGMQDAKDNFRFFLSHYLTKYANSKIVGMDAIYVHLALNYYGKGLADWLEKEQLEKIVNDAKDLEPLLIGKQAPNISMQKKDGSKVSLYDVASPYTIVYFWAYDCGSCKKATPYMRDFYETFKDKGVKIFAVCSSSKGNDLAPCWPYIEENQIPDWQHTIDPIGWSKVYYKVKSTPQMYILDENKKIIMKSIGAEQLPEVMQNIMDQSK